MSEQRQTKSPAIAKDTFISYGTDEDALRRRKEGYGLGKQSVSLKDRMAAFQKKASEGEQDEGGKGAGGYRARSSGKLNVSAFEKKDSSGTTTPTSAAGAPRRVGKLSNRIAAFQKDKPSSLNESGRRNFGGGNKLAGRLAAFEKKSSGSTVSSSASVGCSAKVDVPAASPKEAVKPQQQQLESNSNATTAAATEAKQQTSGDKTQQPATVSDDENADQPVNQSSKETKPDIAPGKGNEAEVPTAESIQKDDKPVVDNSKQTQSEDKPDDGNNTALSPKASKDAQPKTEKKAEEGSNAEAPPVESFNYQQANQSDVAQPEIETDKGSEAATAVEVKDEKSATNQPEETQQPENKPDKGEETIAVGETRDEQSASQPEEAQHPEMNTDEEGEEVAPVEANDGQPAKSENIQLEVKSDEEKEDATPLVQPNKDSPPINSSVEDNQQSEIQSDKGNETAPVKSNDDAQPAAFEWKQIQSESKPNDEGIDTITTPQAEINDSSQTSKPEHTEEEEDREVSEEEKKRLETEEAAAKEAEKKRLEAEEAAAKKAEKKRLELEEAMRIEQEKIAAKEAKKAAAAEKKRLEEEARLEKERLAAEKAKQERLEFERRMAEKEEAERIKQEEIAAREAELARQAEEARLEEERLAAEKAEQERLKRERRIAEKEEILRQREEERLLEEERLAALEEQRMVEQEAHGAYAEFTTVKGDLTPPRELTEEEIERLSAILKTQVESHPKFNHFIHDQDCEDLVEYSLDMVRDGESVSHVVTEVEFMEFKCFTDDVALRFRKCLTKFFSDLQ